MFDWANGEAVLIGAFVLIQFLYLTSFLVDFYLFTRPIDWVDMEERPQLGPGDYPYIVLFYPVLRELEETMRTTFTSLARLDYPAQRYRVVAIPNESDRDTVQSLRRLAREFSFLEIIEVPPTADESWSAVWRHWNRNPKAYWWHQGPRARSRDLPPKKTRQLIYAFYRTVEEMGGREDFLVNYIDADSAPPRDHFLAAAIGMRRYDVLQSTNVAGNLNDTMASTWHSFDHMAWDGRKYPHVSARGGHPYWVLGKGLFFKASDLVALGGFHPWITIEDPEVGMRFWKNGKKLGVIANPLIEEVPNTIRHGITQRKRWVCGFFQSLGAPLDYMGFTWTEKLKAWTNFLPCMSLWLNALGVPFGIWAIYGFWTGNSILPDWTVGLALFNLLLFLLSTASLYLNTWRRTALVLQRRRDRLWYMLRINPLSIMLFWLIWLIPLWIGWRMYRRDDGLVWERTVKINANETLVREVYGRELTGASAAS
jgi:cellulose synthase/poly-beta-1,6-N-acetylglucosamine synthase-like glycosyltransferase